MRRISLLVALCFCSSAFAGTTFRSSPSFRPSVPSYRPPTPAFRPSTPTPRPVVINRTTVVQQSVHHNTSSSSGSFFAPFLGSLGGSMLGSWLSRPAQPQPAPTIDCSLPANQGVVACQPAK